MTWVKKVGPPHDQCHRPQNDLVGVGSVWHCPICGKHWKVTSVTRIGEPVGWLSISDQFEDRDQTR